jgi:hypothetical protein
MPQSNLRVHTVTQNIRVLIHENNGGRQLWGSFVSSLVIFYRQISGWLAAWWRLEKATHDSFLGILLITRCMIIWAFTCVWSPSVAFQPDAQ